MKKTIISIAFMLLVVLLVLQGCTTGGNDAVTPTPAASEPPAATAESTASETPAAAGELTFTLAELAQYDGTNGNPAYIAVDGVVYDVTNVPQWLGGKHNGFTAGHDLTVEIKTVSPHGVSKLVGLPVVGKLTE